MYDYNEFLLTRSSVEQGWGLTEEYFHTAGFPVDEKMKKSVERLQNRFEYWDYSVPGYFLFYDQTMKRFYCAQASQGKAVDRRINMAVRIRVPDIESGDGFMECIHQLRAWNGVSDEALTAAQICERYGIETAWLEQFAYTLYKQAFVSTAAKKIGIMNSQPEAWQEEIVFVTDMMKLCYFLWPSSKLLRMSFCWRVPADKASGARILFTQEQEVKTTFDVAAKLSARAWDKDSNMIAKIVQETLNGKSGERFQDSIDQYYIMKADFESLRWNYYYYMSDKSKNFSCSLEEFYALYADIQLHLEKGMQKAEVLYANMMAAVSKLPLGQEEATQLLHHYLGICRLKKSYTEKDKNLLWCLLRQSAGGQKDAMERVLKSLRRTEQTIYYDLMQTGVSKDYIGADTALVSERLTTAEEIKQWIGNSKNKALLSEPKVREDLMKKLEPFFRQDAPMQQMQSLIEVGCKIDKERCMELVDGYLSDGVRAASEGWNMLTLYEYLNRTQSLWKTNTSYFMKMQAAYENMAYYAKIPMTLEEMNAFVSVRWDFTNKQEVQRMLMEKCRLYLQTRIEGDKLVEEALELLLQWQTGIAKTDSEFVQCQSLLERLTGERVQKKFSSENLEKLLQYECTGEQKTKTYRVWLGHLEREIENTDQLPVKKILEQLEEKRIYLEGAVSRSSLHNIFEKLLESVTEVRERLEIIDVAAQYLNNEDLVPLMETFWNKTRTKQFAEIRRCSEQMWKMRADNNPLDCEVNDKIQKSLYAVYAGIYAEDSIEMLSYHVKEHLKGKDSRMTEAFLCDLLLEWAGVENAYFERILDVLMVRWESEEELFKKIEEVIEDKKEAKQLIRRVRMSGLMDGIEKESLPKEHDIFWGAILGSLMVLPTIVWYMALTVNNKFIYIAMAAALSGIFICGQIIYTSLDKKEKKFTSKCLCVAAVVWSVLLGLYGVTGGNILMMFAVLAVTALVLALYWYLATKKVRGGK